PFNSLGGSCFISLINHATSDDRSTNLAAEPMAHVGTIATLGKNLVFRERPLLRGVQDRDVGVHAFLERSVRNPQEPGGSGGKGLYPAIQRDLAFGYQVERER